AQVGGVDGDGGDLDGLAALGEGLVPGLLQARGGVLVTGVDPALDAPPGGRGRLVGPLDDLAVLFLAPAADDGVSDRGRGLLDRGRPQVAQVAGVARGAGPVDRLIQLEDVLAPDLPGAAAEAAAGDGNALRLGEHRPEPAADRDGRSDA